GFLPEELLFAFPQSSPTPSASGQNQHHRIALECNACRIGRPWPPLLANSSIGGRLSLVLLPSDLPLQGPACFLTGRALARSLVVPDQGEGVDTWELRAPVQEIQFNRECGAGHFATKLSHELSRGGSGASGRQKVVADHDAFARFDGVLMDLERIGTVFELVRHRRGLPRKLFGLPHRNEACSQTICKSGRKDESASFYACDDVDLLFAVIVGAELIDERVKALLIREQRRQIVEKNSGLGIIRDFANQLLQIFHCLLLNTSKHNALAREPAASRTYESAFSLGLCSQSYAGSFSQHHASNSIEKLRPYFASIGASLSLTPETE